MRLLIVRMTLLALVALPVSAGSAVAVSAPASAASCYTVAYYAFWELNCPVSYGDASNFVVEIQREINTFSWIGCSTGSVDGVFGQNTLNGVKCYQRISGLRPDGVVGPKTWQQLENDAAMDYWQGDWVYLRINVTHAPPDFLRVWGPSEKTYVVGVHGKYVQMNTSSPN